MTCIINRFPSNCHFVLDFDKKLTLMKIKLFYLCFFFIVFHSFAKATDTLQIDTFYTYLEVRNEVSTYVDVTNKLSFEAIRKKHFEKKDNSTLDITKTYWATFYMPQDSGIKYELSLPYADSISIFLPQKDGNYKVVVDGILANKKNKENESRGVIYFDNETIDFTQPIFIRFRRFTKWGDGGNIRAIYVRQYPEMTPIVYINNELRDLIIFVGFLSISGFLALFFFIQFLINKRRAYLLYAVYILTIFLYYFNRTEFFHHWIVSIKPMLFVLINEDMQILSSVFYFLFARIFINTPVKFPRFDKVLIAFLIAFLIFMFIYNGILIFDRFNPIHLGLMLVFRISSTVLSLWFMVVLLSNKPSTSEWIIFTGGLVVSLAMVVPSMLGNFAYAMPFFLVEFLIFAIGLGVQVQQSDKERLQTKVKLIEQLEINAGIQQEMQKKLEAEVKYQTEMAVQKTKEAEQAKALELQSTFQRELEKIKMKALQAQMNPHFLFNCLNSIRLFYLKNETKKADAYITKFSRLLRLMLNNSRADFISLQEELDSLQLYIEFEQMRFKDKFDFDLTINEAININEIQVQPLTIQPFVENAIWHGLMQNDKKGKLLIDVKKEEKNIIISIEDNGIGREKAKKIKKGQNQIHQSFGISITRERLEIMKQSLNKAAGFNIIDLFDNDNQAQGTRVEIIYEV